jgi:hypothetical protein
MGEAIRPGRLTMQQRRPRKAEKRRFWIVPVVGVACIFAAARAGRLEDAPPGEVVSEPVPEVVGRWVSADPRYADRGLRIGAREIVLEVGPGRPLVRGDILVVTVRKEGQRPVVHVGYDTGEGPVDLEMILDGEDRMHLRHPSEVTWTRSH